jgi:hypothetical protein
MLRRMRRMGRMRRMLRRLMRRRRMSRATLLRLLPLRCLEQVLQPRNFAVAPLGRIAKPTEATQAA